MSHSTTDEQDVAGEGPVLEYEPVGKKSWRAGTLVYTAGGLAVLFFWLLWGDFAYQLKERAVSPALTRLLRVHHATDTVVGMLMGSLPQLIGILFGPVIAYRSDRHRGKWGRRIPYLLAVTPLTVAAMVGLACSPFLGPRISAMLQGKIGSEGATIALFGFFWMIFELGSVTCNALLVGLVNDVVPREMIGRFFGLFRILSVGAGIVFMQYLMGNVVTHYVWIFVGIGLVYGVSFTAMCLGVREPEYPPPNPNAGGPWKATKVYLSESFTRPYYLWYFAAIAAMQLAMHPINLFSQYFAESVGATDAWYGQWSARQFILSLMLSYPLGWLADKIHPIRVIMLASGLHAAATLTAFCLVKGPLSFGLAHVICGALAGCWITAWYVLTPALVPKGKFAQYFSAMAIVSSLAQVVGGTVFGWLFDAIHHQYRYMYPIACFFDAMAVVLMFVVYRHFVRYGGMKHYVAPE